MATIDERLEALTRNLELLEHSIHDLQQLVNDLQQLVNEGFRALYNSTDNLLKIAQTHETRLQRLEGK